MTHFLNEAKPDCLSPITSHIILYIVMLVDVMKVKTSLQLDYPQGGNTIYSVSIERLHTYPIDTCLYRIGNGTSLQNKMKRFFQQFIANIIFAEMCKVPEDLFNTLISFSLNKEIRKSDNIMGLFQASDLYTPNLRCIILQLLFKQQ